MERTLFEHLRELTGNNIHDEPDTISQELLGELELWTAKVYLQRGMLEEATHFTFAAAGHTVKQDAKLSIISLLLMLAKDWSKQAGKQDSLQHAERVLQRAVELAPDRALPALAQFLQRQKRLPEAIDQWRVAIRLNPHEANHYLQLAALYERTGQPEQALATYMDLIEKAPSGKTYLLVAQQLDELAAALPAAPPNRSIKIALLGNATLDHLHSYLKVECYKAGLHPIFYQSGYDQYMQEILQPQSDLYTFAPDVVICAIHASRLFPMLHRYPFDMTVEQRRDEMNAGLAAVQNLLDTLTQRSPALVLWHNMVAPQYPALGILDVRDDLGQTAMFAEINLRLAEMARTRYRNVYILDEDRIQSRSGKATATDPRLWLTARMGWSESVLPDLAREYLRFLKAYKGLSRKCIILDLDNTLWGGVIGEDGLEGIQLGADAPGNAFVAFQHELEKLWRRGILLAICSKNNPEDALAVFNRHPGMVLKLAHFAAQRINWEPKTANIRSLAEELNIGLDSMVFLDDNPVERARVRAELPQVLVPELPTDPAQYRTALLELGAFDSLALTEEDRNRNKFYAEQKARQEYEVHYKDSTSLEAYLADLQMIVEIAPATNGTLPRIAQLTNKTNQFNPTTRRYSEGQISDMIDRGYGVYSLRVKDRFGDNGLVGVAIIAPHGCEAWEVDTLLLSCRVMGRGVETALLAFIAEQARRSGVNRLQGWYLPTAKNAPVKDLYPEHRFSLVEQKQNGDQLWELDLPGAMITVPTWLAVCIEEPAKI